MYVVVGRMQAFTPLLKMVIRKEIHVPTFMAIGDINEECLILIHPIHLDCVCVVVVDQRPLRSKANVKEDFPEENTRDTGDIMVHVRTLTTELRMICGERKIVDTYPAAGFLSVDLPTGGVTPR